jgi:hypothetical protein
MYWGLDCTGKCFYFFNLIFVSNEIFDACSAALEIWMKIDDEIFVLRNVKNFQA